MTQAQDLLFSHFGITCTKVHLIFQGDTETVYIYIMYPFCVRLCLVVVFEDRSIYDACFWFVNGILFMMSFIKSASNILYSTKNTNDLCGIMSCSSKDISH